MKDAEVFYPNDGDPRKLPDKFVEVNAYFEAKTLLDNEIPTIQGIAEDMGIDNFTLRTWLKFDEQFQEALEAVIDWMDEELGRDPEETLAEVIEWFKDDFEIDPDEKRPDVIMLKIILEETKTRHDDEMQKAE